MIEDMPVPEHLVRTIGDSEVVLGGVNLHQDLHFATFYLRASLASMTGDDYPGYSMILAHYEDGTEQYFIPEADAERTASWLIDRCVSDPDWLCEKLEAIELTAWELSTGFPGNVTAPSFAAMRSAQLLELYRRHNQLHRAMYRYARIPEALDRGMPYFTDHLKRHLVEAGVDATDLPSVFDALTAPLIPSVISDEDHAFTVIVEKALAAVPDFPRRHTPGMSLPPAILDALEHHRKRWGWLLYHGYRHRSLPTEDDYVRRLCQAASTPRRDTSLPRPADVGAISARIEPRYRRVFGLYAEMGRVKLLRRYIQLRNFYFLDLLLAACARELGVTEWEIRCCFPEELEAALLSGRLDPLIRTRTRRCGVIYSVDGEVVLNDAELDAALRQVRIRKNWHKSPTTRHGTAACIGFGRGKARIIGTTGELRPPFRDGEVAVCMAADPDLVPIIRRASAVVSQEGGVTSHASLLCREIGVPTVIGVDDLLEFVRDGDDVEVDATRGTIRRVLQDRPRGSFLIPEALWTEPTEVGRKAANLRLATESGFDVPPFVLLSFDDVVRAVTDDEGVLRRTITDLCAMLDSSRLDSPSFLLRSSALDEDGEQTSQAGKYVSLSLSMFDPVGTIREFVAENRKIGYRGSIILQRFVPATISGVSIDSDWRTDARDKLIIELVRGSRNSVTGGRGDMQRIIYDYATKEIVSATSVDHRPHPISDLHAGDLVSWLSSVAAAFQRPTYTEWGFYSDTYWLYQVRGAALKDVSPTPT